MSGSYPSGGTVGTWQPVVRAGRAADEARLARLIDRSFFPLAANQYLVPDESRRSAVLEPYFRLFVGHALATGTVDVLIEDGTAYGVAIWSDSDDEGPADYDLKLAELVGDRLPRFQAFDTWMHRHTPAEPHAYLAFLAIAPHRQHHGAGSALLRHRHRLLDGRREPAYLVASNERSRELYLRHGYRLTGQPVVLPNEGRMFPMWRAAPAL